MNKGEYLMKKKLCFLMILVLALAVAGCSRMVYQLPHDQFCYDAEKDSPVSLTQEDKEFIIGLLNSVRWQYDLAKCESDFVFYTQNQKIYYHSECGTFNDGTNRIHAPLSLQQKSAVNAILGVD